MKFAAAVLTGLLTGILSSFGIGGGTLLMVYMTVIAAVDPYTARGINLLYFIPVALPALWFHMKNGFVDKQAAIPAILAGMLMTACSSFLATSVSMTFLKKPFGLFLLFVGLSELFGKREDPKSGSKKQDNPPE